MFEVISTISIISTVWHNTSEQIYIVIAEPDTSEHDSSEQAAV